jgi:hypothetical protein
MIAMKFTIELEIGFSFLLQAALAQLVTDRETKTHRRGRSKRSYGHCRHRTEIPEAERPPAHPSRSAATSPPLSGEVCRKGGSVICAGHRASSETRLRAPPDGSRRRYRPRSGLIALDAADYRVRRKAEAVLRPLSSPGAMPRRCVSFLKARHSTCRRLSCACSCCTYREAEPGGARGLSEHDPDQVLDETRHLLLTRAVLDRVPAVVAEVESGAEVLLLGLVGTPSSCATRRRSESLTAEKLSFFRNFAFGLRRWSRPRSARRRSGPRVASPRCGPSHDGRREVRCKRSHTPFAPTLTCGLLAGV